MGKRLNGLIDNFRLYRKRVKGLDECRHADSRLLDRLAAAERRISSLESKVAELGTRFVQSSELADYLK